MRVNHGDDGRSPDTKDNNSVTFALFLYDVPFAAAVSSAAAASPCNYGDPEPILVLT